MTQKNIILAFVIMAFGFVGCAGEQYSQTHKEHYAKIDTLRMIKMDDIIALSKAGVSDSLIIGMMDATDSWFLLKTKDVLDLRNAGVSERVISAMMQPPPQPSNKASNSNTSQYYVYPPYFWYDGFYYPYWYYPSFSMRFGYHMYHPMIIHHRRFR